MEKILVKQQNKKLTSLSVSANLHNKNICPHLEATERGTGGGRKTKKGCRKGMRESEEQQGRKFKKKKKQYKGNKR